MPPLQHSQQTMGIERQNMTQDQKDALLQALCHLEYVEPGRNANLNIARAQAAHYLVQFALSGLKPHNFREVVDLPEIMDIAFPKDKQYIT